MDDDRTPGYSLVPLYDPAAIKRTSNNRKRRDVLSAIAETSRFTGAGRLKSMREDMACCLMKLLEIGGRHYG